MYVCIEERHIALYVFEQVYRISKTTPQSDRHQRKGGDIEPPPETVGAKFDECFATTIQPDRNGWLHERDQASRGTRGECPYAPGWHSPTLAPEQDC